MKLRSDITINGKLQKKGTQVSWLMIYPFFMIHMLAFGGSGFFMAYSNDAPPLDFLYMHGGIAITVYLIFYLAIFGVDEVKWMFINAGLGALGIFTQIDWILSLFDKRFDQFPATVHVIPFLYFVLYTFLLRQAVVDMLHAREDESKRRRVENGYIAVSVIVYLSTLAL